MPRKKELDTSAFGWTAPKELDVLPVKKPIKSIVAKKKRFKDIIEAVEIAGDIVLRVFGVIALIMLIYLIATGALV